MMEKTRSLPIGGDFFVFEKFLVKIGLIAYNTYGKEAAFMMI